MLHGRRTFLFSCMLAGLGGAASAEAPPRLKASWKERDARVEVFSPDGRSLVSSGRDGCRLRDAETGEVRAVLSASRLGVDGARFSPDGRLLFAKVGSAEHKPVHVLDLKAWDVATGREYGTIPYVAEGANGATEHFDIAPDGKTLATLDDSDRLPMLIRTAKGSLNGRSVFEVSYNASPGLPRVSIWSIPDWKRVTLLDAGSHVVFSPDGGALATGSRDWRVPSTRVWDTATWRLRAELDGMAPWVKPMAFSPDGGSLAISGGEDESLWELRTLRRWMVPVRNGGGRTPVFTPDGRLLFPNGLPSGEPSRNMNQEFPCYDLSSIQPKRLELGEGQNVVQPLTYNEARLLVAPAAMKYAVFGEADGQGERTLEVRGLPGREVLARSSVRGLVRAEFSPDGRRLAMLVGRNEDAADGSGPQYLLSIQLVDPATARPVATVPSPGKSWGNYGFTFSPDARSLAVYYRTGSNAYGPGDPEPGDRPMNVEVWEVAP